MCTGNGYLTAKAFQSFLNHFYTHVRPSKEMPALLILDGFSGHIYVYVLKRAVELNISIICFPLHTTHVMQPMDVGIFSPFKRLYREKYSKWIEQHPDEKLLTQEFAGLISDPFYETMRPSNLVAVFEATGLYPVCPEEVYSKCRH
jgi:hypothetical protein